MHPGTTVHLYIGIGSAGLATGAISVFLLLVVCLLSKKYCLKKHAIEVENNVAYETVNFQKTIL